MNYTKKYDYSILQKNKKNTANFNNDSNLMDGNNSINWSSTYVRNKRYLYLTMKDLIVFLSLFGETSFSSVERV